MREIHETARQVADSLPGWRFDPLTPDGNDFQSDTATLYRKGSKQVGAYFRFEHNGRLAITGVRPPWPDTHGDVVRITVAKDTEPAKVAKAIAGRFWKAYEPAALDALRSTLETRRYRRKCWALIRELEGYGLTPAPYLNTEDERRDGPREVSRYEPYCVVRVGAEIQEIKFWPRNTAQGLEVLALLTKEDA